MEFTNILKKVGNPRKNWIIIYSTNSHKKIYILLVAWYIVKHLRDYHLADFHAFLFIVTDTSQHEATDPISTKTKKSLENEPIVT